MNFTFLSLYNHKAAVYYRVIYAYCKKRLPFSLPYLNPSIPRGQSHSELGRLVHFPSSSFLFREL